MNQQKVGMYIDYSSSTVHYLIGLWTLINFPLVPKIKFSESSRRFEIFPKYVSTTSNITHTYVTIKGCELIFAAHFFYKKLGQSIIRLNI